ncbi:type-F conjugative transfer system protein TrbI [Providencia hangzhouensis]|uniref:type-F conjugative transfer system protein TrbI n=1 Tax=Providencia TaxID=586 RepID=UPI000D842DAD|nr:type-F conjugative transfer system protein TrbI [Providencia rettgeri]PYZ51474.1 type-F conjugative transfer system protein TrbI [Providencia rettgeri]
MAESNTTLVDNTQKTPARGASRRRKACLKAMSFFMVIAVVLSFSISVFVVRWLAPVTVTFDMAGTVNQYQQQMAMQFNAENPLSEKEIADATYRFQVALSDSLSEYQQMHQALILVTPAVVMGAEDITVDIQAAIADKMAQ